MVTLAKEDGKVMDSLGERGGSDRGWFLLEEDELLCQIEYLDRGNYSGSSITFITDKGRRFIVEGSHAYEGGMRSEFIAPPGGHIVGFLKSGRTLSGVTVRDESGVDFVMKALSKRYVR